VQVCSDSSPFWSLVAFDAQIVAIEPLAGYQTAARSISNGYAAGRSQNTRTVQITYATEPKYRLFRLPGIRMYSMSPARET
jgi:hypothetical protein